MRDHLAWAGGAAAASLITAVAFRRSRRMFAPPKIPLPLDAYAPLEPVQQCEPVERAGVQQFRAWVLSRFGGDGLGITRACTSDVQASSRHHEGRAWDWSPPSKACADRVIAMLLADDPETGRPHGLARRLGVRTIIWQRRIWTAPGPWRSYHGASPHVHHVHFDFSWSGANGETSWHQWQHQAQLGAAATSSSAVELPAVAGLVNTTEGFRAKLVEVAAELGIDPGDLAAVISVETGGTFSPKATNQNTGAVGLIQWTKTGAEAMGTTRARLSRLTAIDQLDVVRRWYAAVASWKGTPRNTCDTYLAVFAPAFVGAGPETVLYAEPSDAYEANAPLDRAGDGTITAADACAPVLAILADAAERAPVVASVPPTTRDRVVAAVAVGAGLAAARELLA